MIQVAEVRLWGSLVGAVALTEERDAASFEYTKEFLQSGIELSPIMMPLDSKIYRFPELIGDSFHGLPGLLADSLPDRFGNILIQAWLHRQGRTLASFSPIERLCYTGTRGMGALEFFPIIGEIENISQTLELDELVTLASEVLQERSSIYSSFSKDQTSEALSKVLAIGTSAGGARAKAVIAWNPQTKEVRSGQVKAEKGFEYWLLKFDGVNSNKDKELNDPQGYGAIEYAYYLMAKRAGITMNPCQLLQEHERQHFMTKRFDRHPNGEKLHMQTLSALAHLDYNQASVHSYEDAFLVLRRLKLSQDSREELFRRMTFNIIARNQDDHVKNIAFLMDRRGKWSLSPAYDVSYNYQPQGIWTGKHQMSMNGKRDNFTLKDFSETAKFAQMVRGREVNIVNEVSEAVSTWSEIASQVEIPKNRIQEIQKNHRLNLHF
ncbi:MAG: type II toxin-antitoxin system HipA family toxin [Spirochaetia bacterium]|nr:type II toxin-antitoxin system HipA family toxin [Spirochaetia bacterium]